MKLDIKHVWLTCICSSERKLYAAKMVQLKPSLYGILSIEMDFQMGISLFIPLTVFLLFMVFILGMLLAKLLDLRNEHKV